MQGRHSLLDVKVIDQIVIDGNTHEISIYFSNVNLKQRTLLSFYPVLRLISLLQTASVCVDNCHDFPSVIMDGAITISTWCISWMVEAPQTPMAVRRAPTRF